MELSYLLLGLPLLGLIGIRCVPQGKICVVFRRGKQIRRVQWIPMREPEHGDRLAPILRNSSGCFSSIKVSKFIKPWTDQRASTLMIDR